MRLGVFNFGKLQIGILILISILFLFSAPDVWHYTPDGGVYVGTAESMVKEGRYWFNGHPNLQYYPGFSALLSVVILVFGTNFYALHLLTAGIVVISLWLARAYFSPDRYGLVGLALPILLACANSLQIQAFRVLSDGTFLAVTLGALILWRSYSEQRRFWTLAACLLLVAYAPLVRFQGLFLCAAFAFALVWESVVSKRMLLRYSVPLGLATFLPFAGWTLRNVIVFTPDTFNMANTFFFGQWGLALYPPDFARVDWIDTNWLYGPYRLVYSIKNLAEGTIGSVIQMIEPEIIFFVFITLIALGVARWLRVGTKLECSYVLLSGAYLAKDLLWGTSLYTVDRYWLPMLPFVIVTVGFGIVTVRRLLSRWRLEVVSALFAGVLVVTTITSGVLRFSDRVSGSEAQYFQDATAVIQKLAVFGQEHIAPNLTIATTDWGVLPRAMQRVSYPVLADESHIYTLRRLKKYQTQYLVLLEGNRSTQFTKMMVEKDYPQAFTLLLEVFPEQGVGPFGAVYAINLAAVDRILESASFE